MLLTQSKGEEVWLTSVKHNTEKYNFIMHQYDQELPYSSVLYHGNMCYVYI